MPSKRKQRNKSVTWQCDKVDIYYQSSPSTDKEISSVFTEHADSPIFLLSRKQIVPPSSKMRSSIHMSNRKWPHHAWEQINMTFHKTPSICILIIIGLEWQLWLGTRQMLLRLRRIRGIFNDVSSTEVVIWRRLKWEYDHVAQSRSVTRNYRDLIGKSEEDHETSVILALYLPNTLSWPRMVWLRFP
jgi:hypothetical protein